MGRGGERTERKTRKDKRKKRKEKKTTRKRAGSFCVAWPRRAALRQLRCVALRRLSKDRERESWRRQQALSLSFFLFGCLLLVSPRQSCWLGKTLDNPPAAGTVGHDAALSLRLPASCNKLSLGGGGGREEGEGRGEEGGGWVGKGGREGRGGGGSVCPLTCLPGSREICTVMSVSKFPPAKNGHSESGNIRSLIIHVFPRGDAQY